MVWCVKVCVCVWKVRGGGRWAGREVVQVVCRWRCGCGVCAGLPLQEREEILRQPACSAPMPASTSAWESEAGGGEVGFLPNVHSYILFRQIERGEDSSQRCRCGRWWCGGGGAVWWCTTTAAQ